MRNGEYEKAEEALLEAIQIHRDSGSLPPFSLAALAMFLNNHGILLWRIGRLPEAKAALEEALEISHKKVPEYYNGLATLCNLAVILADNDELKAAEPHFQSALSIVENLAQRTPEQYKFYHAIVLHNFSYFLSKADCKKEAQLHIERAIELKHELVEEYPGIFEDSLAKSLCNLGVMNGTEKRQMEWEEKYVTLEE